MSLAQHVRGWTGGIGVWRKLAVALAAAALASGIATYLALTGAPPFGPRPTLVLSLLNLDLVLLLALAAVVAKRLFEVRAERRRNLAGSRLQVRLVGLFSLIAVLPTIIVAVFSYLFFSFGIESWFSDKVRTAISESVAVADAYVKEHQQTIRADALSMAGDLDRSASVFQLNPQYLAPVLTAQAAMRGLTEAAIVDRNGTMLARTGLAFALGFEDIKQDALRRANQGEVIVITDDQEERVRALVRLNEFSDLFLYVGRFIEPRVLAHRDQADRGIGRGHRPRSRRPDPPPQPHRVGPAGRRSRPVDRRRSGRGLAGDGRPPGRGGASSRSAGPGAGANRRQQRHPHPSGAHRRRARCGGNQRLRCHLRRHHRVVVGATQGCLGRYRPTHRPRDQEPADPDPALGRAVAPKIPPGDQEGPGDLQDLHRYDHPPRRGYRAHGRRILVLCADAGAGVEAGGLGEDRRTGGLPAAHCAA